VGSGHLVTRYSLLISSFFSFLALYVFSLNPSSISPNSDNLPSVLSVFVPSSPNRKAAFSRLASVVGRFPVFKNGDIVLGGDDLLLDGDVTSGSSIQENEELAMLDRVGTGAFGRGTGEELDLEESLGEPLMSGEMYLGD